MSSLQVPDDYRLKHRRCRRMPLGSVLLVAMAMSLIAWGSSWVAFGDAWAATADVTLTDGRMQVLLASRPAAGYFLLSNKTGKPLVLSGASAPDCQSLMLHRSTTEGGMARMAMVDTIQVPAHGGVRFSPGGYHLMCMQPSGVLLRHTGTETVTLHFADGGSVSAPFAIEGVRH